ncbi:hypothetical protein [Halopseudomonas pertucinogena]|uniref:Uncharacterized protein n=1 Tax=Halopseudomonas pertucinogena TaxID=86175 RepID=A0ABQ2CR86_9GAMM|nr:hypothetical protein [Halopseudomonas pertucinogena]GGJ05185.1 hypothetical protein GCM10009083_22520 [Halopseudomonas pertucinogena]
MNSNDALHLMLALLVLGFALLGTGYTFRDKGAGVALMLAGSAVVLTTIGARIIRVVSL